MVQGRGDCESSLEVVGESGSPHCRVESSVVAVVGPLGLVEGGPEGVFYGGKLEWVWA